jgi:hypothetical protein
MRDGLVRGKRPDRFGQRRPGMVSNQLYEAIRTGNDEIACIGFTPDVRSRRHGPFGPGQPEPSIQRRACEPGARHEFDACDVVNCRTTESLGRWFDGWTIVWFDDCNVVGNSRTPKCLGCCGRDRSRSAADHSNRKTQRRPGATICRAGLTERMRRPTIDWRHCARNVIVSRCQCRAAASGRRVSGRVRASGRQRGAALDVAAGGS